MQRMAWATAGPTATSRPRRSRARARRRRRAGAAITCTATPPPTRWCAWRRTSLRYPLIDGQGNFGSRDGDGAAAMRYTEARLTKDLRLLLDEIDQGTVDFVPNYDGRRGTQPAACLRGCRSRCSTAPAGIAVGMATEIPSHNLREIADACVALVRNPQLRRRAVRLLPGRTTRRRRDHQQHRHPRDAYRGRRGSLARCARAGRSRTWRAASGSWW